MKKETYRPLPDSVTIRNSKTEGLGLFAKKRIKAGHSLGVSHIEIKYSDMSDDGAMMIRTPLGGFINHSEEPNCIRIKSSMYDCWYLVTLREIKPREELTLKYTLYKLD